MVDLLYVASALVTGIVLVVVGVGAARVRRWRRAPSVAGAGSGGTVGGARIGQAVPAVGPLLLPLLVVGAVATVVAVVGGPAVLVDAPVWSFGVALASVVGLYAVWGAYFAFRGRGRSTAEAVAAGVLTLGLLFVVAVTAKLLVAA
jgi:heme/copper-type cytochrome/quinol oxidase subunit 2